MSPQAIDFSKYEEKPAAPAIDFSKYEAAPQASGVPPEQPGWLDREIPLTSYPAATLSGLQSIARSTRDAAIGAYKGASAQPEGIGEKIANVVAPGVGVPAYRAVKMLSPLLDAPKIPAAISDINQSADPTGTYLKAAQETASQGAGQALVAIASDKLPGPLLKAGFRSGRAISGAVKGAARASGIGLTAQELLTKAGGPSVYEKGFPQALETAGPRLAEQNKQTPIKSVGDMAAGAHDAAGRVWNEGVQPQIDRHPNAAIDGSAIADQIRGGIDEGMRDLFPAKADQMTAFAEKFDGDLSLSKANSYLKTLNAELKAYYKLSPDARHAAGATSGHIASMEAAADGLRDQIYGKLDALGETDPRGLRQEYGALKQVQRVFAHREIVAGRQAPLNLPQLLTLGGGALEATGALASGHPLAALAGPAAAMGVTALKYLNSPDMLVRRGVKGLGGETIPLGTAPPAPPSIPRFLRPGQYTGPSTLPPAPQLGSGILEGEYMQPPEAPPAPPTRIRGALPRGTYAQPGRFDLTQPQLPEKAAPIPLGPSSQAIDTSAWRNEGDLEHARPTPGFYSKAEQVANEKLPNAGSTDAMLATLRNNGVKPAELADMGLDKMLEAAGSGKISKQQILEHIDQNKINLEEFHHSNARGPLEAQRDAAYAEQNNLANELRRIKNPNSGGEWMGNYQLRPRGDGSFDIHNRQGNLVMGNLARDAATRVIEMRGGGRGRGANPSLLQEWIDADPATKEGLLKGLSAGEQSMFRRFDELGVTMKNLDAKMALTKETPLRHGNYNLPGGTNHREILINVPGNKYSNTLHWSADEPNIVHMRVSDHVAADGKKTLVVNEVQSDVHQKGRRSGYGHDGLPTGMSWDKGTSDSGRAVMHIIRDANGKEMGRGLLKSEARAKAGLQEPTPDTPFKKNWSELAMKRVLRYGAENGYDRVAWTTGAQQAERYDLSKQVSAIHYAEGHAGNYKVWATRNNNGAQRIEIGTHPAARLEDVVGKEIADKIIAGEGTLSARNSRNLDSYKTLSGVDLKVGGEGMKGFYDKIIPDFISKYTKKLGGKVGETTLPPVDRSDRAGRPYSPSQNLHSVDITPEMRAEYMDKGQPLYKQTSGGNTITMTASQITTPSERMQTIYQPPRDGHAGFIVMDKPAHKLLSLLRGTSEGWDGVSWSSQQAAKRSAWLRKTADTLPGWDTQASYNLHVLADNIDQAIADNGKAGVPIALKGKEIDSLIKHEAVTHGGQRTFDPEGEIHNFTNIEKNYNHPAVEKAKPVLLASGYPDRPSNIVAEMQAHILDGNGNLLGLNLGDQIEFIRHSVDVLAEHHGPEAIANPPELARGYVKAMQEFARDRSKPNAANTTTSRLQEAPNADAANDRNSQFAPGSEGRGNQADAARSTESGDLESRRLNEDEGGYTFASPNIAELGNTGEAKTRIGGAAHQSFTNLVSQLHDAMGVKASATNAIGAWKDGAENSVVTNHASADLDQLRYSAALQGKWARQKSAIAFARHPDGPDTVYNFTIPLKEENTPAGISERLQQAGVDFHTIVKVPGGHTVVIFDQGTRLGNNVREAAARFSVPEVEHESGKGDLIEADTREAAQAKYDLVIQGAEGNRPELGEIRKSLEAGRDYDRLQRALGATQDEGPLLRGEASSRSSSDTTASKFSTQPTGDQPPGRFKYRADLNREDYYDAQKDPQGFGKDQSAIKGAGYKGTYDSKTGQVNSFAGARVTPDFIPEHIKRLFDPAALADITTHDAQLQFLKNLKTLPVVDEWVAAAQQGVSGRKWYQRSLAAYDALSEASPELFRAADKQKFMDFMAALSPQQGVPKNVEMALPLWAKWVEGDTAKGIAPRSTAIAGIKELIPAKGVGKLEARLQNAHRALAGENLSGYKVSDFTQALQGNLSRAVIDRIMSAFVGKDMSLDQSKDYHAVGARVKQAAAKLGWEPSEVQAAIWVWTEGLLEHTGLRRGTLKAAPEDIAGSMSVDDVASTKASHDVLDLMQHSAKVRAQLKKNGVNLEKLDKSLAAAEVRQPKPTGEGAAVPSFLKTSARRIARGRLGGPIPPEFSGSTDFPVGP